MNLGDGESHTVEFSPAFPNCGAVDEFEPESGGRRFRALLTGGWADFFASPLEFWRPLVVNTAYVNYKGERFSFGGPNIVRKPNR